MGNKRIFLIDANAFCYRAFYALKGLATSFGQPTNAVYGFVNMLNKILKEHNPEFLAACFDFSRNTFRQKKFAEYKIQRPPMPEGLASQLPLIKQVVCAYAIALFEKEGYEADDIIATIVKKAKARGFSATVISSDKDILQLVDDHTQVFSPYKDKGIYYGLPEVINRFGVAPRQIPDLIALMGDDADNIPGVKGIGEKTASQLIKDFSSAENLISGYSAIKQPKLKEAISQNIGNIRLSKELALLDDNMDLDFDPEKLRVGLSDREELFKLFKYLEFKSLLKNMPQGKEGQPALPQLSRLSDQQAAELISSAQELYLQGSSLKDMVFCANGIFFTLDWPGSLIKGALREKKIKKIGHGLKNIKSCLAQEGVVLEGIFFDTLIAAYLLDPSKGGYSLEDLANEYLGASLAQESLSQPAAAALLPRLRPLLEERLRESHLLGLFKDLEMPLVSVLSGMESIGIKLDLDVLDSLSKELEERLIRLVEDIYSASGCQFNINSPKQLRDVLFEKLKLPVVKRGKSGPSTDEEVLRKLEDKHHLPKLLLEYRQLSKLKSTYIDALPALVNQKTGRVHTSFNQAGTETGRLSSSNPNLQNIPVKTDIGRRIRQAVVSPAEGCYLLSCDYSQVELRVLAHLCKDSALLSAFCADDDIHRATASLIYGLGQEEIGLDMRNMAKRVNFGIIYGLTAYGLSRDLNISAEQAQEFIEEYFLRYPGVKDYIRSQIDKARQDGFVATILGRRRYIPEINNKNQAVRMFAERQAVNAPIQGSASDLIKTAMINIDNDIKEKKINARMVLQIHDELLFEVAQEEMGTFSLLAKERMEGAFKLEVPLKVDMKKGRNWLEMEPVLAAGKEEVR